MVDSLDHRWIFKISLHLIATTFITTSVPHQILIFPFDVTDSKHEYEDADPDFKNIVDPEQEKYQHKLRPGGGTVILYYRVIQ